MDLGCLDLGCISVSDKQGTEAAVSLSESRDENLSENTTARSKIGKVINSLDFRFVKSRIFNLCCFLEFYFLSY